MPATPPRVAPSAQTEFDVQAYLDSAGTARRIVRYRAGVRVFAQGGPCDSVMYLQGGGIKLSVLSRTGKEAVVAMLAPGDFFGEGALSGQTVRIATATTTVAS